MSITAERKAEVIKTNANKAGDTGSPEVQVAILSERINNLTGHFKIPREGQSFAPGPFENGRRAVPCSITSSERTRRATRRCSKSITFVVEYSSRAHLCARFRMVFGKPDFRFPETSCARARIPPKRSCPTQDVQQQSGSWAGQDARTTERMDAIRNIKTMAGSPDADLMCRSASRHLAHGLCVWAPLFREPMKEDLNVQYSFSRDRLGWPSPQA